MPRFQVVKVLSLVIETDADDEEHAEQICINTDESEMALHDCQYEVTNLDEEDDGST